MKKIIFLVTLALPLFCSAQKRGNVWCFGDSAGIDFNNITNPIAVFSGINSRGSCATVADTNGNLLFITAGCPEIVQIGNLHSGKVYDKFSQIMQGGDSLVTGAWYNELVIIPHPVNSNLYYVFSIGVTALYGLYYSIVDISQNGGLGEVIQKNIQLQTDSMVDCLNAIKHGNGRDWWLFFRRYTGYTVGNNEFHSYLITPQGITNYTVQNVGSASRTGLAQLKFNKEGNRICFNNYRGLMELYDFDRCSGIISNPVNVYPDNGLPPWPSRWSNEFSPSGDYLYLSVNPDETYLIQFDLTAASIAASADTLWTTSFPQYCGGLLKRDPYNQKIYFSAQYYNGIFPYPYADSIYNMYNMNLSVINSPDSLGTACDFQPYSFYLGGKRTYLGLPNNPDYDMPPLVASPCDSLTGIPSIEQSITNAEMFISYINSWQKLFINAQHIKGKNCLLQIFDMNGRIIFSSERKTQPPYFTMDVSCAGFAKGMYVVSLQTEKEKLVKKFVKD